MHRHNIRPILQTLVRSTAGIACLIAVVSVIIVATLARLAPRFTGPIDWGLYDTWIRVRAPIPVSPSLVFITRTAETDSRFGAGPLDHALLARMITALNRAGASVIGLDIHRERPNAPGRSGATSDAMLIEATRTAGRVVYPLAAHMSSSPQTETTRPALMHASWPPLTPRQAQTLRSITPATDSLPPLEQYAMGVGHIMPDNESGDRQAVLLTRMGDRAVPSFGLALAVSFFQVAPQNIGIRRDEIVLRDARLPDGQIRTIAIPVDRNGRLVINHARATDLLSQSYPFIDMWDTIDRGEMGQLQEWVRGKIVLILSDEPQSTIGQTSLDSLSGWPLTHAQVLNTIMTEHWITGAPAMFGSVAAIIIGGLASWLLFAIGGWLAAVGIIVLGLGYIALATVALWTGNLVLPLMTPLATLAAAAGGTSLWTHLTASRRIGLL
ncbi:MAG TPA: CHASE2 domain-containing protein, partial [Nitrospiraceae bacterium]|nr:CHASE2 domain-containing protein [Nitrospiraceae bacterium]